MLLAVSILEILKDEWLGIIASTFVLISFLSTKQIITRIINLVGCVIFVAYGLILPAYSTAFLNIAIIIVHIVFIVKHFRGKRQSAENSEIDK